MTCINHIYILVQRIPSVKTLAVPKFGVFSSNDMEKVHVAYFIFRVTSGQERITADILQNKSEKISARVSAIIISEGLRGYVILEAEDETAARELIADEPHMKGMLSKPLSDEDLKKMLEVKKVVQEIGINDIVEFVGGPFKGYKAKVLKVEPTKEEITVELMDVAVPIPVTTKSSSAKIVQKAEKVA